MESKTKIISPVCKRRLYVQGYQGYSDKELNEYKYGIRFAYILCATLVALGLVLSNIPLLITASIVAFIGIFPPYHPFDYLYNYAVRHLLKKPKIPQRTNQGRFACGIAFVWLTIIIYLIKNNHFMASYIMGGILLAIATMVSVLDICIPSMVYNFLFGKKNKCF
jgi:hypothetical protein